LTASGGDLVVQACDVLRDTHLICILLAP
jgi:hypothetical protein